MDVIGFLNREILNMVKVSLLLLLVAVGVVVKAAVAFVADDGIEGDDDGSSSCDVGVLVGWVGLVVVLVKAVRIVAAMVVLKVKATVTLVVEVVMVLVLWLVVVTVVVLLVLVVVIAMFMLEGVVSYLLFLLLCQPRVKTFQSCPSSIFSVHSRLGTILSNRVFLSPRTLEC